jgi:stearoyl-CoA desaturase (delta-9 desaturase)
MTTPSMTEASTASANAIPGVVHFDERSAKIQRRVVLFLTIFPFAGFIAAIVGLWGPGISLVNGLIALSLYFFTGLGVTVGYHRLFTHQSFEAHRILKIVLAVAGSMSLQGSLISWVATHRRHHAFSDQEGDPHSPHLDEGPGIAGVIKGLWHAHMGWLTAPEGTDPERWAPDMLKDKDLVLINRLFPVLAVGSFVLPAVMGLLVSGTLWGGVMGFLWGGLARIFFLHHVTWSINSICHFYGRRPFESRDFSTNNWMLAIVSFGESWHNNHHAFPTSAVHGIGRGQIDMSGWVIRMLEKMRLARTVKIVSAKQLAAKAASEFHPRKWIAPIVRPKSPIA